MSGLKRVVACFLLLAVACEDDPNGTPSAVKAESGFAESDDGWRITGDAQANSVNPDFYGVGGNPGGLICAKDDVTGGVWFFEAPPKYLGDNSAYYGARISFDLKVTKITDPFDYEDLILEGAGITLAHALSPVPGETWTAYSVPLVEGGWKKSTVTGATATASELKSVLGNVTGLLIRGEFNSGADTGCLDNVVFGRPRSWASF